MADSHRLARKAMVWSLVGVSALRIKRENACNECTGYGLMFLGLSYEFWKYSETEATQTKIKVTRPNFQRDTDSKESPKNAVQS